MLFRVRSHSPASGMSQEAYMEKGCFIKEIGSSAKVIGLFVVSKATQQQTRNGRPYWRLLLTDASGALEAKIWEPESAKFPDIPIGSLIYVKGRTESYNDQLQLTVEGLRILSEAECQNVDYGMLMPASPVPPEDMYAALEDIVNQELTYAPWRKFVRLVFHDDDLLENFCIMPAAKTIHHAYRGGLLEHTLSVVMLCQRFADQYPELDRQTLIVAALFHDIGKIREFSGGIANDYTDDGRLMGHLTLGVLMLEPFLGKSGLDPALQQHLKHLILSHHGTAEYGAVRPPQTPEALALHYADNLDAKMAQCRNSFAQLDGTDSVWTPWQKGLDRHMFRPIHTPQATADTSQKKGSPRKKSPKKDTLSLPGLL